MELINNVNKTLRDDLAAGLKSGSRLSIAASCFSIPSNIAEGQGRNSDREFIQFLSIARGSLWELETQIEICLRIGYIDQSLTTNIYNLIAEISKMINALSNSLKPQTNV